jgi:hypothetical protein
MRAGFSAVDVTPAIGGTLNGFIARLSPGMGVDLPLYAPITVHDCAMQASRGLPAAEVAPSSRITAWFPLTRNR